MGRFNRRMATVAMASLLALASLLAGSVPVMAAYFWGPNQTSTKSTTAGGASITSKIVYKIGYSGGAPALPMELHVVSMKLTVSITNAQDPQELDVMTVGSDYQGYLGLGHKYWQKIYSAPYPGCNPYPTGNCSFSKTETLPSGLNFPYSTKAVGIYGGGFGWWALTVNIVHEFVTGSIYLFYP